MVDWDEDSSRLHANLRRAARLARDSAVGGDGPSLELARAWHRVMMDGLDVPDEVWVGRFRGESGLEEIDVRVGPLFGTDPQEVEADLTRFITTFDEAITLLEETLYGRRVDTPEHLRLVVTLAAWAHAEWIRIHPFANGNGRTARLWANWLLMRFGIPPFVRLRPRPEGDAYARAGAAAMQGDWRPTVEVFESMISSALR